jgi:polyisoprenoid-binding protein YceI
MSKVKLMGAVSALLLIAAAPSAFAQAASNNPGSVEAGTYQVEPYHTEVEFSISHFGFSNFLGFFTGASGTLKLDPEKLAATQLDVTIPVSSVDTTVPVLNDQLKGDQWFDSAKFANATFTSTKVTATGKTTALITGDLTLHGVTKPVTLKARLVGSGVNPLNKAFTVGFDATGQIKRSDFGIKTYLPMVGDQIALRIAGSFERAQ